MRILFISNFYPPLEVGGWEQNAKEIADRLANRGHEICVLTSNYKAGEAHLIEPEVYRKLYLESPDIFHYHVRFTLLHRWRERHNRNWVRHIISTFNPDVISIWGMWNLSVLIAQEAERLRPNSVIYHIASYWPTESDAHTAFWQSPTNHALTTTIKTRIGAPIARLFLVQHPRNRLQFRHVLCVSNYMRRILIEEASISPKAAHVVHNGIDLQHFPMRKSWPENKKFKLLYIGRLIADKGVHTAIEGMYRALKINPEFDFELTIVGSGDPSYERKLRQLVEDFDLFERVSFLGWIPRHSIPAVLQCHDIFILPSIWPEPLARTTQEAMATGLVVVGTMTGGTPEILKDMFNGVSFQAGDPHDLAHKLRLLSSNPALYRKFAVNARKTVEKHFTLDRMAEKIEHYFQLNLEQNQGTYI